MSLFRPEAVDHQRARLWGEVMIIQPTQYFIIVLIMALVLSACLFFLSSQSYARKESATGYLVPEKGVSKVFPDRQGVLQKIYVQHGANVRKGDRLFTVSSAKNLLSGISNLEEFKRSLSKEQKILDERLANIDRTHTIRKHTLTNQRDAESKQIEIIHAEINITREKISLAEKKRSSMQQLLGQGFATQESYNRYYESLLNLKQQYLTQKRSLTNSRATLQSVKLQLDALPAQQSDEIATVQSLKENLNRKFSELEAASGSTVIAPVDGEIVEIKFRTGETVSPAQSTLIIHPINSKLIGKLLLPSRAAGLIKIGQPVKLQYDAFPYQRFGVFDGFITGISNNITIPGEIFIPIQMAEAFYVVDIALDSQTVNFAQKHHILRAGMHFKADILLEQRSLLEWIFDPILSLKGSI